MRIAVVWMLAAATLAVGAGVPQGVLAEEAAAPPGPRGPGGPDVPLDEAEQAALAARVTVDGRTAAAVQAACDRAAAQGAKAVLLPAGEYVFDAEVRVPAGLTVLGEGARTVVRACGPDVHLFSAAGDGVRFTRLKLQGISATPDEGNNSYGINVSGRQNVRIDHAELTGFSYATNFADEAAAQVDHCAIHHNLRDGLGYGVAIYSGAHVLVCDNAFSQNRHSLASNGALDWSSPKRLGRYVHKSGVRKTHWEFIHNRVGPHDESRNELCAVDTHPGMDGTFVIEGNVFEGLRHAIGIRDGSGVIRGNVFRDFRGKSFRKFIAISIAAGAHNGIPVEGCMPHDVVIEGNVMRPEGAAYEPYAVGEAKNIVIDGRRVPETAADAPPPPPLPRLVPMDATGTLGVR